LFYLPETFFTNQKSKAPKITTRIKTIASLNPKMPRNKKLTIDPILNNKVNKTTQGLFACCKKLVKSTGSFAPVLEVPEFAPPSAPTSFTFPESTPPVFFPAPEIGIEKSKF
jgi:hypothetical protein